MDDTPEDTPKETPEPERWFVKPEHDALNVPPDLECEDDDFTRDPAADDVYWGSGTEGRWELRVELDEYKRGETATMRLTNVSDEDQQHGDDQNLGIEVYTQGGWKNIEGYYDEDRRDGRHHTAQSVSRPPGSYMEWNFELTTEDITPFPVCPDLPEGRYRFVYFGANYHEPLAVAWDMTN